MNADAICWPSVLGAVFLEAHYNTSPAEQAKIKDLVARIGYYRRPSAFIGGQLLFWDMFVENST